MSKTPLTQGKGDRDRTKDRAAYAANWDRIFGKPKSIDDWVCSICGKPIRPNDFTGSRAFVAGDEAWHEQCRFGL